MSTINVTPADFDFPPSEAALYAENPPAPATDLPPFLNVPITGTIGDEATEAAQEPPEPEWEDIARLSVRRLLEAPEQFIVEFDADLMSAYAELTGARFSAMKAALKAEATAQELREAEREGMADSGYRECTNDKQRADFLAGFCHAEREALYTAEEEAKEAAVALEGAKDTVNYIRARLRLYQTGFLAMAAASDLDEGGGG